MTLLRLVLLLAMVLVVANAQTTQAIPKIPKDCSILDLTVMSKKCCKSPPGDLATPAHLKVCNPTNDKALNSWINGYMLNKLQHTDTVEQKINIKSGAKWKLACKAATFINCIFNHYKIMDTTFTKYNGTAAMKIINQTLPNRSTRWIQELLYIEDEYAPYLVREEWNRTIECPTKKAGVTTPVFIGNLDLMQALHIHLAMSCEEAVAHTKQNKCYNHEWNFWNCMDGTYYEINAKKAGVPDWLKEVNQKDKKVLQMHLRRMRSGL